MTVHVFGSPSPAVAIYCLRRPGSVTLQSCRKGLCQAQFRVDDGLASFPSEAEAISILKTSQEMLAESNIRLHKIASNGSRIMQAFPQVDLAKDLKDIDVGVEPLPLQRSLGLSWNVETDRFTFCMSRDEKPLTKRGILSTLNRLFDPLGFVW